MHDVSPPSLIWMIAGSFVAHAAAISLVWLGVAWAPRLASPPQTVLVTKLVRLGEARPKELLPQKETPPPPPPPPPPATLAPQSAPTLPPVSTPPAQKASAPAEPARAAASAAKDRAAAMSRMSNALERLKRSTDGQQDGSVDGDVADADLAILGNKYGTEVQKCVQAHYVIEGSDPARVANLQALVLVRIESNGTIANFRIVEGSGVAAFDQAVGRAVQRCGRVSPPPAELRTQMRRDGIEIMFKP